MRPHYLFPVLLAALAGCDDPARESAATHPAILDLQAGSGTTCALVQGGSLWCWGASPAGFFSQTPQVVPEHVDLPAQVTSFALARGGSSLCAADSTGATWCEGYWFYHDQGVAYGTGLTRLEDSLALHGLSSYFGHVCGVTADHFLACWGSNLYGKRGQGTPDTALGSVILNRVVGGDRFVAVATGRDHTCGIREGGTVACWGLGDLIGTVPPLLLTGDACFFIDLACAWSPALLSLQQTDQLAAGSEHTCARAGVIRCWGRNAFHQLGDGTTTPTLLPAVVPLPEHASDVTAGVVHTCAVGLSGTAYCWGDPGPYLGHQGNAGIPGPVATDLRFTRLSAGINHTCGVTKENTVYCWGAGAYGALGNGDTLDTSVPVAVVRTWEQ